MSVTCDVLFCWQEVMFMGNGEQYIWKPPEDEELLALQNKALGSLAAHTMENIQPSAAVVSLLSCYRKIHVHNVTL